MKTIKYLKMGVVMGMLVMHASGAYAFNLGKALGLKSKGVGAQVCEFSGACSREDAAVLDEGSRIFRQTVPVYRDIHDRFEDEGRRHLRRLRNFGW